MQMSSSNESLRHKRHSASHSKMVIDLGPAMTGPSLIASLSGAMANISTMKSVWQERRKLENLSDAQLRDIGVSPRAAQLESKRSFVDIPEERRRTVVTVMRSKLKSVF